MRHLALGLTLAVFLAAGGCSPLGDSASTSPSSPADAVQITGGKAQNRPDMTIAEIALGVNADTGEFSTLLAALEAAGLVQALDDKKQFTVFAPTDAAFAAAGLDAGNIGDVPVEDLRNILLYHVSPGRRAAKAVTASDRVRMLNHEFATVAVTDEGVFIDEAMIVEADIFASNGVIHVIDAVLMPGTSVGNTIVDVARAVNADTGEFGTLLAALETAGLVAALDDKGQFTVFAPTDAAFDAAGLNPGNIGDVPVEELTNILLYHVSRGRRTAATVTASDRIRMLNREFATVSVTDAGAFIDDAMIVMTDIFADNGVIHVIDGVLMP